MGKECPRLNVLIGIPGAGKSHWIKQNQLYSTYYVVSPDDIRRDIFKNISDQSNNPQVFDIAKGMIIAGLSLKNDVILDATNCNTAYRNNFLEHMPYCKMVATLFEIDPKIAVDRVKCDLRESRLRSEVPASVVYRMYGEYLYTKEVIKEECFSHIVLVDAVTGKEKIWYGRK